MFLDSKPVDDLTEADLQHLIEDGVAETRRVDYKSQLPSSRDSDKKEFLKDVSSFANAWGGYLIFGMEEVAGVPTSLKGVELEDQEAEVLRLTQWIRTGVSPQIPGYNIKAIPLSSGNWSIVIKIPNSWAKPHMVIVVGSCFFSRTSTGRHDLDAGELRALYQISEGVERRIREFRDERLKFIHSRRTPVPTQAGPKTVLHVVSISAFGMTIRYNFAEYEDNIVPLLPIGGGSSSWRHNLDGFVTYAGAEPSIAYTQLFRNGIVEAVAFDHFNQEEKLIDGSTLEQELKEALVRYAGVLQNLGVYPPVVLLLSLLSVKGFKLIVRERRSLRLRVQAQRVDREHLVIPELFLDALPLDPSAIDPLIDDVWLASGSRRIHAQEIPPRNS